MHLYATSALYTTMVQALGPDPTPENFDDMLGTLIDQTNLIIAELTGTPRDPEKIMELGWDKVDLDRLPGLTLTEEYREVCEELAKLKAQPVDYAAQVAVKQLTAVYDGWLDGDSGLERRPPEDLKCAFYYNLYYNRAQVLVKTKQQLFEKTTEAEKERELLDVLRSGVKERDATIAKLTLDLGAKHAAYGAATRTIDDLNQEMIQLRTGFFDGLNGRARAPRPGDYQTLYNVWFDLGSKSNKLHNDAEQARSIELFELRKELDRTTQERDQLRLNLESEQETVRRQVHIITDLNTLLSETTSERDKLREELECVRGNMSVRVGRLAQRVNELQNEIFEATQSRVVAKNEIVEDIESTLRTAASKYDDGPWASAAELRMLANRVKSKVRAL